MVNLITLHETVPINTAVEVEEVGEADAHASIVARKGKPCRVRVDQADFALTPTSTVTTRPTAPNLESQWARATTAVKKGMCTKWRYQPSFPANHWRDRHSKSDCPQPRKSMGACYNCGEEG